MIDDSQSTEKATVNQAHPDSPYNRVSFYFGRITENPTTPAGVPLNIKPVISSAIIPLESDVIIDNAFVLSIERGANWALYHFTDTATDWLKAQFLVSYRASHTSENITHKWFDSQQEAISFADSLSKT